MFEFGDDAVEFVDQRTRASFAEYIDQRTVIPERAVFASAEPVKDSIAFRTIIGKNFAGVGQFVSGGNQPDVFEFVSDLFDVSALSFAPFPFLTGSFVGIRAPSTMRATRSPNFSR